MAAFFVTDGEDESADHVDWIRDVYIVWHVEVLGEQPHVVPVFDAERWRWQIPVLLLLVDLVLNVELLVIALV